MFFLVKIVQNYPLVGLNNFYTVIIKLYSHILQLYVMLLKNVHLSVMISYCRVVDIKVIPQF